MSSNGPETRTDWSLRKGELSKPQQQLVDMLAMQRDMRRTIIEGKDRAGIAYLGMHDFLLQHGRWYEPTRWMGEWETGAPKMCFGNALVLGFVDRMRYVEGAALSRHHPLDIHHGWNTNDAGELIDTTWLNQGIAYLGVEFSIGRADYASWFDDGSVLQNPGDGYAIFREPWTGEDFGRPWKKSPGRIKAEQARDGVIPAARRTMRTGRSRPVNVNVKAY